MSDKSELLETITVPGHRIRVEQSGGLVYVRVYSSPDGKDVFSGALIFTPEEWESFRKNFTWYGQNYAAADITRGGKQETPPRDDANERYVDPLRYLSGFKPKAMNESKRTCGECKQFGSWPPELKLGFPLGKCSAGKPAWLVMDNDPYAEECKAFSLKEK